MPWQQQPPVQQLQLQPLVTQNINTAAAGLNSPLGTSCSSSDSMDPAVLELEQFMLQELAAAGMLAMDSSSATRLPEPPMPVAAPAPAQQPQMNWQAAALIPQQQQQQAAMPMPAPLQHQCSGVYPAPHQQWHSLATSATAAGQHHATAVCAAAPAAVRSAVPMGVACMVQPMQLAPVMPAVCAAAAAPAVVAPAPARQQGRNAHVMAQLQDRLYALQSQMEDMQLMLGLLQNA
jgi:hypothetical protein